MNTTSNKIVHNTEAKNQNLDPATVKGFGKEWKHFNQFALEANEQKDIFEHYFRLFPWHLLPSSGGIGMDVGCGSGRWAKLVAPRVEKLYLLDASLDALTVAKQHLKNQSNVEIICSPIEAGMFSENTLDFAYSLGVLHHLPDTVLALKAISKILKPGAPFLVFLYYAFDNKPLGYRFLWKLSEGLRFSISRSPFILRLIMSEIIAYTIYWPLARMARVLEYLKILPTSWPLTFYRNKSLYTMRTDALDRFGTRLEKRFSKAQIHAMLSEAGFKNITFSDTEPYWCALAFN